MINLPELDQVKKCLVKFMKKKKYYLLLVACCAFSPVKSTEMAM